MKVLFITTFKPDEHSKEGKSGFTWTIYQYLNQLNNITVDILNVDVNEKENLFIKQMHIWGILKRKISANWHEYDKVLIYPDALLISLPEKNYFKTIVLAPDATSMARWSKYRAYKEYCSTNVFKMVYQYLFAIRFLCFEQKYIKKVKKYVVVGINDRRWLRFRQKKEYWGQIKFLPHPLTQNALVKFSNKLEVGKRRFVFAGDMSYSYVGENIKELAQYIDSGMNDIRIDILVVGKKNRWIYDIFKKIKLINCKYIEWVENYQDVCQIGRDVHCVPLKAGAGTKNRVLTAIANGLELITTYKGAENIPLNEITHIYITNNMKFFAEKMIEVNKRNYNTAEINKLIDERFQFRKKIKVAFEKTLNEIME